jgi:hypothetical protein
VVVALGLAQLADATDPVPQLKACGLALVGAGIAVWGARVAWRLRLLLTRTVVARLDDDGVGLRTGSVLAPQRVFLAWDDVDAVALLPVPSEATTRHDVLSVILFVPRSDDRIQGLADDAFNHRLSSALGLSPTRAATALGQTRRNADRVPLVLGWLAAHRPDIRVVDNRG